MIANASQVRIPCESPVPSRPVPSLSTSCNASIVSTEMDGSAPLRRGDR